MVQSHDFYTMYQNTYTKYTEQYGKLVCVFLKKGSFYELYGQEDPKTQKQLNTAKEAMEIFGIAIHSYPNEGPNNSNCFFGGVPEYTLDKWAGKLTSLGWTVVVIDEIKNGSGKVAKREVTRVLSPGTHIEVADTTKSCFLSCMWLDTTSLDKAPTFGLTSADLTTGQVYIYDGQATGTSTNWHTDDVRHCFQVYPPRELLLMVRGSPIIYDEDTLRRIFHLSPLVAIHQKSADITQQGAFEKALAREQYLTALFQPKTALPLRTWLRVKSDSSSLSERALCCLLRFAEDHAPKLAECLQGPKLWHPKETLQIVNNALTQLNLVRLGSEQQCIEDLFIRPLTAMGKRSLTARLCTPLTNAEHILKRQEQIQYLLDTNEFKKSEVQTSLSVIYDIARLHRNLFRGSLNALDVVHYYESLLSLEYLLPKLEQSPFENSELEQYIQLCMVEFRKVFDIEKAKKSAEEDADLGFLTSTVGVSSELAEKKCAEIHEKAADWLRQFRNYCGIEVDAAYFKPTEKITYTLHITKSAAKTIESVLKKNPGNYGKLHIKTLTSNARIEHTALDEFQASLDAARQTLQRCLAKELPNACILYSEATRHTWQQIEEWIIDLDLAYSMAKTSEKQGWVKPVLDITNPSNPSYLSITDLRHPLIENQKRQSKYVTHTIELGHQDNGQGWLLYGMNASGKSSLMKAIGLAVCLAQIGCFVPATSMKFRPFQKIATRILNQDNLWAGLSSFAVEMSELRDMFQIADHQTLVLGDELCSGTESISATAIVAAGIQWLHKAGARFVLATHLHDLTKLPAITSLPELKLWHLHVEYDITTDRLVYHRTLRPGSGSTLYGLEVARALHLPFELLEAAFQHRRELLGDTGFETANQSSWNSSVVRSKCELCNSTKGLEVHHLQERHQATSGKRNSDGTALNHPRNLAVLCQECHDKHHSGETPVSPIEDTSDGPMRPTIDLSKFVYVPKQTTTAVKEKKSSSFTDEQEQQIKDLIARNKLMPHKLLISKLKSELQIKLTEAQYKKFL